VLRSSIFVLPGQPIQRVRPPKGDAWLHEVKLDGYRMQIHKAGRRITIFTRNGYDCKEPVAFGSRPQGEAISGARIDGNEVASGVW
jgi:ATP-dependent DNA ligase